MNINYEKETENNNIFSDNIKNIIDDYYKSVNLLKLEPMNKDILLLRLQKLHDMIILSKKGNLDYTERSAFSIKNIMASRYTNVNPDDIENINISLNKVKYLVFGDEIHLEHALLILYHIINLIKNK